MATCIIDHHIQSYWRKALRVTASMKHENLHLRATIILVLINIVTSDKTVKNLDPAKEVKRFCNKLGWDKKCKSVNLYRPVVAFTALVTHPFALGEKSAVIYDKVLTNIGNGYNNLTGHFRVPVSGLYSISASMMGDPSNWIHLNLVRNGIELVRLYTQNGRWTLASHTINIPLRRGDHLWVRSQPGSGKKLWGKENYNVFSATLLRNGKFD